MKDPKNKRLADIYYNEIMNGGSLDRIPGIIGDDFIFTIPTHPDVFRGAAGFAKEVSGLHGAFPDVHLDVHHLWCFHDLILGLWTGTGTHTGTMPLATPKGPVPATGRRFVLEGVSWIHADGTMLRENLANEDTLRLLHALGLADFSALYRTADAALVAALQTPGAMPDRPGLMADSIVLDHPLLSARAAGAGQVGAFFARYWWAFSDVSFRITRARRGADVNAYRWEFDAVHSGDFFGIPASGRRVRHQGVSIHVLNATGRVQECFINENLIVLMAQLAPATDA